jgi:CDGSH-type Zn-finger protein
VALTGDGGFTLLAFSFIIHGDNTVSIYCAKCFMITPLLEAKLIQNRTLPVSVLDAVWVDGNSRIRQLKVDINLAKTVAWCACKHSKNKPFCDGSHCQL